MQVIGSGNALGHYICETWVCVPWSHVLLSLSLCMKLKWVCVPLHIIHPRCVPCFCIIFQQQKKYLSFTYAPCSARAAWIRYFVHKLCILYYVFFISMHASTHSCVELLVFKTGKIYGNQIFGVWILYYNLGDLKYILPWDVIFKLWDICVKEGNGYQYYCYNVMLPYRYSVHLNNISGDIHSYWIN